MTDNKSTYEKLLEELEAAGNIQSLSGEDHLELMQELNKGMVEFELNQRLLQQKAEIEIRNIIIF